MKIKKRSTVVVRILSVLISISISPIDNFYTSVKISTHAVKLLENYPYKEVYEKCLV